MKEVLVLAPALLVVNMGFDEVEVDAGKQQGLEV